MLLREHPLMSRHNVCNWPPIWAWTSGSENKRPRGEIGILKGVSLSKIKPADRCYLYIDHEGSSYIGCLLFDDPSLLQSNSGATRRLLQSFHCGHRQLGPRLYVVDKSGFCISALFLPPTCCRTGLSGDAGAIA